MDFALPERFDLSYIDNYQRATAASDVAPGDLLARWNALSAFIWSTLRAILPAWLAPEQVRVVPVSEEQLPYAQESLGKVEQLLGMRAELDSSNEKLGAKIRDAQLMKVPFAAVVGKKEVAEEKLAIRKRGGEDLGALGLQEATALLLRETARPTVGGRS